MNPFPDKERELKTWLSAETGPSASLAAALELAPYFHLDAASARGILGQVTEAVGAWREVAVTPEVGMSNLELRAFEPAFEHEGRREAKQLLERV